MGAEEEPVDMVGLCILDIDTRCYYRMMFLAVRKEGRDEGRRMR